MLKTTWERATADEEPFVCYLACDSSLPTFKTRKSAEQADGGTIFYRMRLPFTPIMLERRAANGRAVPEWWRQVDTFTVASGEET